MLKELEEKIEALAAEGEQSVEELWSEFLVFLNLRKEAKADQTPSTNDPESAPQPTTEPTPAPAPVEPEAKVDAQQDDGA